MGNIHIVLLVVSALIQMPVSTALLFCQKCFGSLGFLFIGQILVANHFSNTH
jgi:hypothetical protein